MRWVGRLTMVIAGIVVGGVLVVFAMTEWIIRERHDVPSVNIVALTDQASVAEGGRLAWITHCRDCHLSQGQGKVIRDQPYVVRMAPPGLAALAVGRSDADLARTIRYGVHADGTTLFNMPTSEHVNLADDDLARIIGWIRSLPVRPPIADPGFTIRPVGRLGLLTGQIRPSAQLTSAAPKTRPANDGDYLVAISCLGCHQLHAVSKAHNDGRPVPALAAVGAAYDPAAFHNLLHTGWGISRRDLGLMRHGVIEGLNRLSDREVSAIQDSLRAEEARHPTT